MEKGWCLRALPAASFGEIWLGGALRIVEKAREAGKSGTGILLAFPTSRHCKVHYQPFYTNSDMNFNLKSLPSLSVVPVRKPRLSLVPEVAVSALTLFCLSFAS